jgi:hypothetical protein
MADKVMFCSGCFIKVAVIREGSMLIKEISMLCCNCETKRIASDLANKTKKPDYSDMFNDIFKTK